MKHSFDYYKATAREVLSLLIKKKCSSMHDIDIIYNLLMRFPYCIDGEHYIYDWEIYDNMESLPFDALMQIIDMNSKR